MLVGAHRGSVLYHPTGDDDNGTPLKEFKLVNLNQLTMTSVHYSKVRKIDDDNKIFCNACVRNCYKKFVNIPGNATVLDTHHYNTTKSLLAYNDVNVYLAQHDDDEFYKMGLNKPVNVKGIEHGDYSKLNYLSNVVIDHADFCCGWNKIKQCMFDRLQSPFFYGDRAIVRLTLCYRNSGTEDFFIHQVMEEYMAASKNTRYAVKPLTIKQWCNYKKNRFNEENANKTVFRYNPSMVVFMFLLVNV